MPGSIGRRTYIKQCSYGLAASGFFRSKLFENNLAKAETAEDNYQIYFGDLHNHNSVGTGLGTLERSFDIARSHLDFFCFTPHAYAAFSPTSGDNVREAYKIVRNRWQDVLTLNRSYHEPGKFVTFPGYERFGHYGHLCIIFPTDDQPLIYFENLSDFQNHAYRKGALLIPHHPGYAGRSGIFPNTWDPRVTPILEIFSEHGNAECDTAPYDYIRHSGGGRITPRTLQAVLAEGYRVGIVASTDGHLGFPGAYGEGLAAILAPELTREALFDALRKRRTYGVTGDRILVDFRVNAHLMGEEIPYARERRITANISGWDWIDHIEVLKNNRVIHRDFPVDRQIPSKVWNKPVSVRIEFGWGPMALNQKPLSYDPPVYDWDMKVTIEEGKIVDVQPCFQSGPLEENRRSRINNISATGLNVQSYTSRRRAYEQCDTNAVVLKVQGNPRTNVAIELIKPSNKIIKKCFSELLKNDHSERIARTSLKIHRLIPADNTESSFAITDDSKGKEVDWYYLRVVQRNGHLAWSSPIWVEKKA